MRLVGLDRTFAWRTALLTVMLLWPLIFFGRPTYFIDSVSYYKGGQAAVTFAAAKLAPVASPGGPSGATTRAVDPAAAADGAKGARSIVYSVATYVLRAPGADMALVALAQALATALTMAAILGVTGVRRIRTVALIGGVVAVATPAAFFVNLIVPDIFAGLLVAILALFATAGDRLSRGVRIVLLGVASFAVTAHASHVPLAAGLFVLGGLWLWFGAAGRRGMIVWLAGPLALGVAATMVTGLIGFGTVSIAAKRFPLTLARSIEDGPARWYLERQCATQHYAVCEIFGTDIPRSAHVFLWGPMGVTTRATPAQMDRIRAEEREIVVAAARAYPLAQVGKAVGNTVRQIGRFGLAETRFSKKVVLDATGTPVLAPVSVSHTALLAVIEWLSIVSAAVGAAWLAVRFRRLERDEQAMVLLLTAGIIGNAFICAAFSAVADRYQARVVWLVPLFALALLPYLRRVMPDAGEAPQNALQPVPQRT